MMAYPFFQGNMDDLMKTAGTMGGSYVLGQMMSQQRREQESKIQGSLLEQELKKAEEKRKQARDPFDMEILKKRIEEYELNNKGKGLSNQKTQVDLDTIEAAGGAPAAGKAIQTERAGKEFKLEQDKLDKMNDELALMKYYPSSPQMDKSFVNDVGKIMEKYGLAPDTPLANNIIRNATSPEAWQAFQEQLFLNSPKGRELKANRQMQAENAMAVERERTARALQLAELRSKQAAAAAKAKNFQAAATMEMQAAYAAIEAGDQAKAAQHQERANNYAQMAQAQAQAGARVRQEGGVDVGALTEGGIPTRPREAPVTPFPQGPSPQPQQPQQFREGQTATNPQTGQKAIFRNGQWVPVQ